MLRVIHVLATLLLLAACAAPGPPAAPADDLAGPVPVVVTSNGWHTGIAVRREDVPAALIPETRDFPDAAWFEFGWGDAEYYPAPDPGLGTALRAALQPTPAVMHLVGLPAAPEAVFPRDEIARLHLSEAATRRLVAAIAASFARPGAAPAEPAAPGLHAFSAFYPATGRFHLFDNCNTWSARMLAAAGLPLSPAGVVTAGDLMARVGRVAATLPAPKS